MPTIAYIANEFPNAVEWYVADEIRELRRRGIKVVPCSAVAARAESVPENERELWRETLPVRPFGGLLVLRAAVLCICKARILADLLSRVAWSGTEPLGRRIRALGHTLLGTVYALRLRGAGVDHIHAHHGFYASWIAMVAARLLNIPFSLTLHGSDLLLHPAYLDVKLKHCAFCRTISEFNRRHILKSFPSVPAEKILVRQLGVDVPAATLTELRDPSAEQPLKLLAVGRLHSVKNHQFLIRACYLLRACGVRVQCLIVGDGPERPALQFLIAELQLCETVSLIGAVPRQEIDCYYEMADLVVLTSRSEGIPLVLMEAMARARLVLAPAITGISELVIEGKTGFLYQPEDLEGFVWRVEQIGRSLRALDGVRRGARERVRKHFERTDNLRRFVDAFVERLSEKKAVAASENPVLQQI